MMDCGELSIFYITYSRLKVKNLLVNHLIFSLVRDFN